MKYVFSIKKGDGIPKIIPVLPTSTPTLTPTPTITPSITKSGFPTPTPSITKTPTLTPTITKTPTLTPSITKTPTLTPTITKTPTVTPTITPLIMFNPPFRYLLIGNYFLGEDFDTAVAVNNIPGYSNNYNPVGSCPFPSGTTAVDSLSFGGDIKTDLGAQEQVLVDLASLSAIANSYGASTVNLGISGNWFTSSSPSPSWTFILSISAISGGVMVFDSSNNRFTSSGGTVTGVKQFNIDPTLIANGVTCPSFKSIISGLTYYINENKVQVII